MRSLLFLFILPSILPFSNTSSLPDWPYTVVWNCATILCINKGVSFDVTKFDILQNDNDSRAGKYITLLPAVGRFPVIEDNGEYTNGGIPQLGDLVAHVGNVTLGIKNLIPDENYDGLAVIDFEAWRPLFEHNFDSKIAYQNASIDLVKNQNPSWTNESLIVAAAKAQWDNAARMFMESTLMIARQLRPYALWGYYEFPRCFGDVIDLKCTTDTETANDQLMWLFEASTAFFPSLYLSALYNSTNAQRQLGIMKETRRLSLKRSTPVPIFPYTQYLYERSQLFLDTDDILFSYLTPALSGASGAVIWGGTATVANQFICEQAKMYVDEALGPTIQRITQWAQQCSEKHCSKHGRCITISESEATPLKALSNINLDYIQCDCYIGYTGSNCAIVS